VTAVHRDGGFFEAHLVDPVKRIESLAEFDIDRVFDDVADAERLLYVGSELAFTVVTVHGRGSPQTVTRVTFVEPYVWKEDDDEEAEVRLKELFPTESPFGD
jgi:hypothetical protein